MFLDDQSRRCRNRFDAAVGADGDVELFSGEGESLDGECADGQWACRAEVEAAGGYVGLHAGQCGHEGDGRCR